MKSINPSQNERIATDDVDIDRNNKNRRIQMQLERLMEKRHPELITQINCFETFLYKHVQMQQRFECVMCGLFSEIENKWFRMCYQKKNFVLLLPSIYGYHWSLWISFFLSLRVQWMPLKLCVCLTTNHLQSFEFGTS